MATLFELTTEMQDLYALATEEDDQQAFLDTLEGLQGMLEQKAGSYVDVIKQLEMEAKVADQMASDFVKKRDIRKNNVKRMKEMLLMCMERLNITSLDAGHFTVKVANNGGVQPLVIDGEVPDSMTKVTIEPDNNKIREYLKDHEADWAHLEERGKHIVIK